MLTLTMITLGRIEIFHASQRSCPPPHLIDGLLLLISFENDDTNVVQNRLS